MKVTLYNAISIDGFIATPDGNSGWVSEVDENNFAIEMDKAGCIVVGRRTFEQYIDELYPVEGITNIVVTSDADKEKEEGNVIYTSKSPAEILKLAASRGHDQLLLIGGGITNALFLDNNLIDELILSVHPLILGQGIRLFESKSRNIQLEHLETIDLDEGLIQARYKVVK